MALVGGRDLYPRESCWIGGDGKIRFLHPVPSWIASFAGEAGDS